MYFMSLFIYPMELTYLPDSLSQTANTGTTAPPESSPDTNCDFQKPKES